VKSGQLDGALAVFDWMRDHLLPCESPQVFTTLLSGCTERLARERGRAVLRRIKEKGFLLAKEALLAISIINFYGKTGDPGSARCVMEELLGTLSSQEVKLRSLFYLIYTHT